MSEPHPTTKSTQPTPGHAATADAPPPVAQSDDATDEEGRGRATHVTRYSQSGKQANVKTQTGTA